MTILLAGSIGAGKTTLSNLLSEEFNIPAFHEPIGENPILPLYYKDQKKYAYPLQMYLLSVRSKNLIDQKTIEDTILKQSISDRSLNEDLIFAQQLKDSGNMSALEYEIYTTLEKETEQKILNFKKWSQDDCYIYLKTDFKTALNQIKKRNRAFEQLDNNPSLENYYYDIWSRYEKWFENINNPKIILENYDLINNPNDALKYIKENLSEFNIMI